MATGGAPGHCCWQRWRWWWLLVADVVKAHTEQHRVIKWKASFFSLSYMQVLNLGKNSLEGKLSVGKLRGLKALILNDNQLARVGGLERCRQLNTLVLSHNHVEEVGGWLAGAASLVKLTLSHNVIADVAPLRTLTQLQELRLNHNQLSGLPGELAALKRLRILEAGGNPITSWEGVQVGDGLGGRCRVRKNQGGPRDLRGRAGGWWAGWQALGGVGQTGRGCVRGAGAMERWGGGGVDGGRGAAFQLPSLAGPTSPGPSKRAAGPVWVRCNTT